MVTETPERQATTSLRDLLGFKPTRGQEPVIDSRRRFTLITGGEQAGKSMVAAQYLLERMRETEGKGLYWLVAADYDRTSREFEYLTESFEKLGWLQKATKRVDPGEMILVDGTVIKTKSAKDPRTLAQEAPNGILLCEAGVVDLETYWRCRGRTAPKRGWLFMIGTMEGSIGWFPTLSDSWLYGTTQDEQSFRLPTWTNTYLYEGGRDDPEIKRLERDTSDDWFMERMAGVPSPPKGAVFANYFRPDIHIQPIEWEPDVPVRLWIDPGYAGGYAVHAVQIINDQVRIFDEIYEQNLVTEEIISVAKQRPWWRGDNISGGVIDIAGRQHQAMPAVAEIWIKEANLYLNSNKVGINDGIERMKQFLKPDPITGVPKIIWAPVCRGVISELGGGPNPFDGATKVYRWKIDKDQNIVGDTPEDRWNHGIKADTYGIVDQFGYGNAGRKETIKVTRWR